MAREDGRGDLGHHPAQRMGWGRLSCGPPSLVSLLCLIPGTGVYFKNIKNISISRFTISGSLYAKRTIFLGCFSPIATDSRVLTLIRARAVVHTGIATGLVVFKPQIGVADAADDVNTDGDTGTIEEGTTDKDADAMEEKEGDKDANEMQEKEGTTGTDEEKSRFQLLKDRCGPRVI